MVLFNTEISIYVTYTLSTILFLKSYVDTLLYGRGRYGIKGYLQLS